MPFKPKNDRKINCDKRNLITLDNQHDDVIKKINYNENIIIPSLKSEKKIWKKKLLKIESEISKGNPGKLSNLIETKIEIHEKINCINEKIKKMKKEKKDYFLDNSTHIFSYFEKKKQETMGNNKKKVLQSFFKKKNQKDSPDKHYLNFEKDIANNSEIAHRVTDNNGGTAANISSNKIVNKTSLDILNDFKTPKNISFNKKFLMNINKNYININEYRENIERCHCGGELISIENEGIQICNKCYVQIPLLVEHEKPSYREPPKEVCFYAYKRINHFKEIIAQFQGKETTQIPTNVMTKIKNQIKKERITLDQITNKKAKNILKKLGLNKYYEHIPFIKDKLGIKPPIMSTNLETKLCNLFMDIQAPYARHCPDGRVNFLNYYYVLYKMCELLGENVFLPHFPMLKDREKRIEQDIIWKKICDELDWEFIPTI